MGFLLGADEALLSQVAEVERQKGRKRKHGEDSNSSIPTTIHATAAEMWDKTS